MTQNNNQALRVDLSNVTHLMFHGGFREGHCKDGFMAATLILHHLKPIRAPVVFPWDHQQGDKQKLQAFLDSLTSGNVLLMLDVCLLPEHVKLVQDKGVKVLLIDHHKSSEAVAASLPAEQKVFDQTFCGSHLVHQLLFPSHSTSVPLPLAYINAHDLGQMNDDPNLPAKQEFVLGLNKYPQTEDAYWQLLTDDNVLLTLVREGTAEKKQHELRVEHACLATSVCKGTLGGNAFVFASVPVSTHTIINDAAKAVFSQAKAKSLSLDFVVTMLPDSQKNTTGCSFRVPDAAKFNAVQIAQMFDPKSGGHPGAAGLGSPLPGQQTVLLQHEKLIDAEKLNGDLFPELRAQSVMNAQ